MKNLKRLIILFYVLMDSVLLGVSFCLPHYLYYKKLIVDESHAHPLVYAFWIVATILLFNSWHLYLTVREITFWSEIRRIIRAFVLSTLFTILLLFSLKIQTFSRLVLAWNFAVGLSVILVWRITKRMFVQFLVSRGFNNMNILIVGAGKSGQLLAEKIRKNPQLGFRIMGFLDDFVPVGELVKNHPVLGRTNDFDRLAKKNFIERVFITIPSERQVSAHICNIAKLIGIEIYIVPDNYGHEFDDMGLYIIDGMPVLEYHRVSPNYQMIFVKRVMDIIVSTVSLILLSPLFLLISAAIKLDSRGPVFYSAKRWGVKGRLFKCYKFRSMVSDADALKVNLLEANEMDGPVFKMKDDPRITRVGKFLRKYSLDELPQIWNVLKGDMSLVGPRPLPESEQVGDFKLEYLNRLKIKPGLTCLWQIRGRNDIPFERWMKLDDYYIRNWSPGMDIQILLRTVPAIMKGKGAY